jgi:hypothetical protein
VTRARATLGSMTLDPESAHAPGRPGLWIRDRNLERRGGRVAKSSERQAGGSRGRVRVRGRGRGLIRGFLRTGKGQRPAYVVRRANGTGVLCANGRGRHARGRRSGSGSPARRVRAPSLARGLAGRSASRKPLTPRTRDGSRPKHRTPAASFTTARQMQGVGPPRRRRVGAPE